MRTPSSTPPSLRPNDIVGSYVVLRYLGGGELGEVHEVEHVATRRRHALKILRTVRVEQEPERIQRLLLEARVEAQLNHENIVRCTDAGIAEDGRPWLVMDLVAGLTGRQIVAEGPVPMGLAFDLGRQLVAGLAGAHRKGIVHRDVKPENYLVARGVAKLVDFGLVQVVGDLGGWRGTVSYMSPEQLLGEEATAFSDVYSVSLVIRELILGQQARVLGGRRPLGRGGMLHCLAEPLTSLSDRIEGFPRYVADVLDQGLAADPADRWTAVELGRELKAAQERFTAEFPPNAFPVRDGTPVHAPDFGFDTPPLELQGHAWIDVVQAQGRLERSGSTDKVERASGDEVPERSVSRPARIDEKEAAEFAKFDALVDKLFDDYGLARNELDLLMAEDKPDAERPRTSPALPAPSEEDLLDEGWSETGVAEEDEELSLSCAAAVGDASSSPPIGSMSLSDATPGWPIPAAALARTVEDALADRSKRPATVTSCGNGLSYMFRRSVNQELEPATKRNPTVEPNRRQAALAVDDARTIPDALPPPGCSREPQESGTEIEEQSGQYEVFFGLGTPNVQETAALALRGATAHVERSRAYASSGGRTPVARTLPIRPAAFLDDDPTMPRGTVIVIRRGSAANAALAEAAPVVPTDRDSAVVQRSVPEHGEPREPKRNDDVLCGIPVRRRDDWWRPGLEDKEISSLSAAERLQRGLRLVTPPIGGPISAEKLAVRMANTASVIARLAPRAELEAAAPVPKRNRRKALAAVSTVAIAAGMMLGFGLSGSANTGPLEVSAMPSASPIQAVAPPSISLPEDSATPKELKDAPTNAESAQSDDAPEERTAPPSPPKRPAGKGRRAPVRSKGSADPFASAPLLGYVLPTLPTAASSTVRLPLRRSF